MYFRKLSFSELMIYRSQESQNLSLASISPVFVSRSSIVDHRIVPAYLTCFNLIKVLGHPWLPDFFSPNKMIRDIFN